MNIIELKQVNLRDVPAGLRQLADLIESGEQPAIAHAVVVARSAEDDELLIYGYGNTGRIENEIGLLQTAVVALAQTSIEGCSQ